MQNLERFSIPQYEDGFDRVFRFDTSEWQDEKTFWIQLSYYVHRDHYTPKERRTPLDWDVSASSQISSGERIFKNLSAAELAYLRTFEYVLLKQTPTPDNVVGDIYAVTELYGFPPPWGYKWTLFDYASLPGIDSGVTPKRIESSAGFSLWKDGDYYYSDLGVNFSTIAPYLFASIQFGISNVSAQHSWGSASYSTWTALIGSVEEIAGTRIKLKPTFVRPDYDPAALMSKGDVLYTQYPGWRFNGPRYISLYGSSREAGSKLTNFICEATFSFEEPNVDGDEVFNVYDSTTGKIEENISASTKPSLTEWQREIAVRAYKLYEEPGITQIEGGIWQKITKKFRAQ